MLLLIYILSESFLQLPLLFVVGHKQYIDQTKLMEVEFFFLRKDLSMLHNDLSLTFNNFSLFD